MTFPWLVLAVFGFAAAAVTFAWFTRQYLAAAVAASAGILLVQSRIYFDYTSDDAFISYRYARNFADGVGLVFNRGDHVEGYSNFLWVLILAGLHKAGADIVLSGRWLGFGLAVAAGGMTYLLTLALTDSRAGRMAGLVAALLLAACGSWSLWATAGLESSLFAALTLAGALLHLRERERGGPPLSAAVWGLVAMTRPDGIILFAVSGLFKAGDAALRAREGSRPDVLRREVAQLALYAGIFAALFVPYFAWRYSYYGWLFPNTYYAKVGSGIAQYNRGIYYVLLFSQEYGVWLLLLVPLATALGAMRRGPAAYVLCLILAWMASSVYVGGDALLRYRLLVPTLPLFYALATASAASLISALPEASGVSQQERRIRQGAIGLVAVAILAFTLYPSANGSGAAGVRLEPAALEYRTAIGRWMRDNMDADATIALVPAGTIPYESHLRTIDILGLTDEHIAHRDVHLGGFAAGHEKYDSNYVLDQKPQVILLYDGLTFLPLRRADYNVPSVLIPGVSDLAHNARLDADYLPRAVQFTNGLWLNMLVRRDAEALLNKTQAIQ